MNEFDPIPNPVEATKPNHMLLWTGVIFSFLLLLISMLLFGVVGRLFHPSAVGYYTGSRIMFWICLGILLVYVYRVEKQPLLLWKDENRSFLFYLAAIPALIGIVFFGSAFVGILLKYLHLGESSKRMSQVIDLFRTNIGLAIFTCLTAAVVEELFFRGYIMPRLKILVKKDYLVVLISSFLFGILHFGYGTVSNVVVPVYIGAVFAVFYLKFRDIKTLIAVHFLWDFMVLMINIIYLKHGKP